ncbi:MAG: M1 family metallopeptidase [Balneolales bacterium]
MRFLFINFSAIIILSQSLVSCSSTGPARTSESMHSGNQTEPVLLERPLPGKPELPFGYRKAVEKETRTWNGRPGKAYWQQFARYELEATLIPEKRTLAACARIVYYNRSPDTLRQLQLELVQNLHAEGIRRNRQVEVTGGMNLHSVAIGDAESTDVGGRPARYQLEGTRMIINLPEPLAPGSKTVIEIEYDFVIPQQGAGNRMGYSNDNLFFLGYWYPHMVVYDDVLGWHPDEYLGQAEFYHGFADYDLTIHAPEQWLVMATGELQNAEEVLAQDVLQRWEEAKQSDEPLRVYTAGQGQPVTTSTSGAAAETSGWNERNEASSTHSSNTSFLTWRYSAQNVRDVAFSATSESNWDVARTVVGDHSGDGSAGYTVINAVWRDEASLWSEVTAYQQHAITYLSKLTGYSYPWPHMTAVEGAGIIGGGMEFPMMTIMGDYNRQGAESLYSVTAHELAHMWIPMIVSTNERRYSWLDEGNTVFSTGEAVMDHYPEERPHLQAQTAYIRSARLEREGPMMRHSDYHYSTLEFIIASYRKPASVLIALRQLLGEEAFWEAYRTFIEDWAFKHAYPWDFFHTFERVSGRNLGWFWRSWYYETWQLNQAVELVEETDEGTRIVIRDEGNVPMPVWLTVTFDRDQKVEYTIPVDPWLQGKRQAEIVIPEREVRRVEIDAGRHLPDINRKNSVWEQ